MPSVGMHGYPQAVVFKGKVYIGGGLSSPIDRERFVMVYDPQRKSFYPLPPYTYWFFSMTVVNNQLVMVGGADVNSEKFTNQVRLWNEQSKTWPHPLPPMTIACSSPSVVVYKNKWLVIIGGFGDGGPLSRVEILDTATTPGQWYLAAPLPQPCYRASTATIGNMCYLVGGFDMDERDSRKVFGVCLDDLISQAVSQPAGASAPSTSSPWTTMPDTPLIGSTALCLNGALMAVGGSEWSTTIYHYQPSTRSWIKAGEMPIGRQRCACTVLPSGELFVTAGGGYHNNAIVDIASVEY